MDEKGEWMLAPAYDLTFSSSAHGMHSTTVAGEGKLPGEKQLIALAQEFGVQHVNTIIKEVKLVCSNWIEYANEAEVSKKSSQLIHQKIKELISN